MFKVAGAVLATALLGATACSSGGPEDAGEVDQRVIDAVAPVSAASASSHDWYYMQVVRELEPEINQCLEDGGRGDLASETVSVLANFWRFPHEMFPDTADIQENGLSQQLSPKSTVKWEDQDMILACLTDLDRAGRVGRVIDINTALWDTWLPVRQGVLGSQDEGAAQDVFADCVTGRGFAGALAGSERGGAMDFFRAWLVTQQQAGVNMADGTSAYIDCGEPVWEQREKTLKAEREAMVEKHLDDLVELSGLVQDIETEAGS